MTFEVELQMFQKGAIRKVTVPDKELTGELDHDLGRIYYWGQNDFQNDPEHCSVSAGDIVRYNGTRYLLSITGAKQITNNGGAFSSDPIKKIEQLFRKD